MSLRRGFIFPFIKVLAQCIEAPQKSTTSLQLGKLYGARE